MTSLGGYDPTKEGAGDGIGPSDSLFFARNMAVGDSAAGAMMMTHQGLADMADISGGPALAPHHHGSSFGEYHHRPLQQFADVPHHGNASDGTPIDPSLFDQLALEMAKGSAWPGPVT